MDNEQKREKEVKVRMQTWYKPSTLEIVDRLYKQDNCRSRTEFIEKAILFYAGYLSTENARGYLPNVVPSTLKAIVDNSDNRQNRMTSLPLPKTLIPCPSNDCAANVSKRSSDSTAASPLRMRSLGRKDNDRWQS